MRLNRCAGGYGRSIVLVCGGAAALFAGVLVGCNGKRHGQYTSEGLVIAQQRLAELKSGTEWQMAQQQYLGGDFDKALKTIDRSIALNPNVAKSHLLRGRILVEKSRLQEAKDAFDRTLELQPENVEAVYFLGIVHERFSMDQKAFEYYSKAMEKDPTNPQYLTASAEMLVSMGRMDDAERLLLEHRESFGYSPAVRQTLGHIAVLRGQHRRAAEYFNDALLLAPEDHGILEDLARSQVACGEFGLAEFNLGRLLNVTEHRDRKDLQMLRAKCLLAVQRPVEARSMLQKIVNTTEGASDPQAWIELGNVAMVLKDRGNLRLAGARTTALAPNRFEGYMFRASFLGLEGKTGEALATIDQSIQRSGNSTLPFVVKATMLRDAGRLEEARTTLAQALQRNPGDRVSESMLASLNNVGSMPGGTALTNVPTDGVGSAVGGE
ncbi:MAG: tetratricopeptide repeat protein [Phycisphaeraceae bacterium]|nr:tetratricopeptide repeat protein [Phycisphaeraceae bacterium]